MTTRAELAKLFDDGVKQNASHMIIFVDTYDYENYAVFVKTPAEAREKIATADSMQRVMEVYNMYMDKDAQLTEQRAYNL